MTKLFSNGDDLKVKFSTEEFINYYSSAKVVSTESVSDYLYGVKDKINTLSSAVFTDTDKAFLDATSSRYQVNNILKRVHFADLANEIVSIPERFNGSYVDYLKTMISTCDEVVPEVTQLLNNIKMAISGFINEYSEDGILTVYGKSYAAASEKLLTKQKTKIAGFFPTNKSNSSARVKELVRNNGDIEYLLVNVKNLESSISHNKLKDVLKLSREVSEMVDTLIEQNNKSGVLLKNDTAKKDLVEMIHTGALGVEFTSYLYANTVYFYNALKSLTNSVLVVGNR